MTWRDEYQPGSFRGAAFRTASHERSGGRRVSIHELVDRDEPVVEDMGRRARQFQIDCHVIGADYRSARDALIDALEAKGTGLLVHPWHGQVMVAAMEYTTTESTEDGGVCWFQVTFMEAGEPAPAPVSVASGAESALSADAAIADAPGTFADGFSIDEAASWVEDAAGDLVSGMAAISQISAGLRGGAGSALRAFDTALRFLPGNISGLMRAPLNLGHAIVGLVSAVSVLGSNTGGRRQRLAPLQRMLDWQPQVEEFPALTAQRRREADNRTALVHLFRTATAAELVRAATLIDYPSYDEARATRDVIAARLDALAIEAADRGDDAAADTFDGLRRALARDIAAKGETLARVYALELSATEPALVVAHRHYRRDRRTETSLEARAADIARRNAVSHPGFLPGGVALQLLTGEATA